jgi:uncharacterized protein (DUF1919 family)
MLPNDFYPEIYLELNNDIKNNTYYNKNSEDHYLKYGIKENRIYKYSQIPDGYSLNYYNDWITKKNSNIIYDIPFEGFKIKKKIEYKFLYYLAAIGNNYLDKKLEILEHNLNYIYKNTNNKISIIINCYELDENICNKICNMIKNLHFIDEFYFYKKIGILPELYLTNPYNNIIDNYDYILFILDDVKILDINLYDMIRIQKKYNFDILSTKVHKSNHKFMNMYDDITVNNFLEIFILLLTPKSMNWFLSVNTLENKNMWGIDHLFGYYNISTAVINKYSVNHELPSSSNKIDASTEMINYFKKFTPFKNLDEIYIKYKPIKKIIKYDDNNDNNNDNINKNCCIITNNCYGSQYYTKNCIKFNTPFIGLFFFAPCYIKLLENFEYYMNLTPINKKDSIYGKVNYPVGQLDDIEIHFLHYANIKIAINKWEERKKRMNNINDCIIKMCDRDFFNNDIGNRFINLKYKNKILFITQKYIFKSQINCNIHILSKNYEICPNGIELENMYPDWYIKNSK